MSGFSAHGKMIVKNFKSSFLAEFGVPVRVYNGARFADDSATVASIRSDDAAAGGTVKLHGNMKVKTAEDAVKDALGIKIQIEDGNGELANNGATLGSLRG
jgi:hypothetical protein